MKLYIRLMIFSFFVFCLFCNTDSKRKIKDCAKAIVRLNPKGKGDMTLYDYCNGQVCILITDVRHPGFYILKCGRRNSCKPKNRGERGSASPHMVERKVKMNKWYQPYYWLEKAGKFVLRCCCKPKGRRSAQKCYDKCKNKCMGHLWLNLWLEWLYRQEQG